MAAIIILANLQIVILLLLIIIGNNQDSSIKIHRMLKIYYGLSLFIFAKVVNYKTSGP